jgi:hypothetical protein
LAGASGQQIVLCDRSKKVRVVTRIVSPSSSPQGGFGIHWVGWTHNTALSSMAVGFLIAFGLAAIVISTFGADEPGTVLALRVTARWSFLLFWLAYVGGAMARLFGSRLDGLARMGRELGLAFASAQLIHIAFVLWLYHIATGPSDAMTFFWLGIVCLYALALSSLPQLRNLFEPRTWRVFRTIAIEYIALVFAEDFILGPLLAGDGRYPWSYVPFGLILVVGVCLRVAAFAASIWPRRVRVP